MLALLKNIVTVHTGVYAKPTITGNAIYLQASMLTASGALHVGIVPNVTIEENDKHLLQEGDVLFVAKGAGNSAVVYSSAFGPAIASSTFLILKPMKTNNGVLLPDYLAWYLNHSTTQAYLKSQAKGSSMLSISKKTLEELEVPVPSLQRQQQVLNIQRLRDREKLLTQRLEALREQLVQNQLLTAVQR
ncbi:restriction endonuclease subunit S [uncultured Pontibacter sp.]|uniref:restriction endonuclease subunit S n=1 Tax=uncultured Pontibacter sp. TaxID=453356 RepID=UPI00261F3455|nr:restriction endonuclease subunit S [uncultured Pontibacter sp.]